VAFTKTPTQDTYDTKRFPLVGQALQRNGTDALKDQRLLNCYVEQIKAQVSDAKKFYVKKRQGLTQKAVAVLPSRGIVYEPTTGKHFVVWGNELYSWNGTTLSIISTAIPGSWDTAVGFTVHLSTTVQVIMLTGVFGFVIDPVSNVLTQITDPDFPTPHLPYPQSMDGYVFVAKANTADIYNSDLDDPFSWTPGNFITAEMYPDYITALTKNNNYIIAVGQGSMEFFFDAGTATGSPLARNESAVQQFGTPAPDSVVQTEKEVILVGDTGNGGYTVWMVEGFKAEEVGTEAVRLVLNAVPASSISTVNAMCIRVGGHKFYILNIPSADRTFVLDCDSKLWSEWSTTVGETQTVFMGRFGADSNSGYPLLQSKDGGLLMEMNETAYQDINANIKMQFPTLRLDFDSLKRKGCSKIAVAGDWPLDTTSTMYLEWSDDDYRTWSPQRALPLSTNYPWTRRCGRFTRRALRFTHTDAVPVRLEACEMDLDMGVS